MPRKQSQNLTFKVIYPVNKNDNIYKAQEIRIITLPSGIQDCDSLEYYKSMHSSIS